MNSLKRQYSWHIARDLLGCFVNWFVGAWGLLIVVVAAIIAGIAVFDEPSTSIFAFTLNPAPYWFLVFGAIVPFGMLHRYVANGVTRRDFAVGGLLACLILCVLAAALGTAAFYAEGLAFSIAGWEHSFEDPHMFSSYTQVGLIFVNLLLVLSSHMFAGWVGGALFLRYGAWALPGAVLAYAFAAVVDGVLGASWVGRLVMDNLSTPYWPLACLVGVVVIAGFIVAGKRLLADVPVAARNI